MTHCASALKYLDRLLALPCATQAWENRKQIHVTDSDMINIIQFKLRCYVLNDISKTTKPLL